LAQADSAEAIHILPVAIRHRLVGDVPPPLARAIARLERAARLPVQPREPDRARLRRVADSLHPRSAAGGWPPRGRLAEVAHELRVELPDEPIHRQLRALLNAARDDRGLSAELQGLVNWVAIEDGLDIADPSPECLLDIVQRLEVAAFGRPRSSARRRCLVRLGRPVDVRNRLDDYKLDRHAAAARLTGDLQDAVQGLLDGMDETRERPPANGGSYR
jgi:hypothetical protein